MRRPRYDGSVAQATIAFGYPREDVKKAIVEQIKVTRAYTLHALIITSTNKGSMNRLLSNKYGFYT